ncbi:SIMPL domain-containing protein [Paenimyroides aestuarii]|uniref:SIMPL domain-containing protein n=1 Tax=Paenimyroides aestuarii TaxID=2968490 RepID=A0ABY5NUF8_9FLAO|nr:SIMPL domain-containing protein [Paenimyroides aestuarii]UUV22084.1 SIMPL domain-containing protein [Paenimyroides aestuarii]
MKTFITVLFAIVSQIVFSQNLQTSPFIEVVGTAEKEIVPDEIIIAITLKEHTDSKNKISIEEQEASLLSELKKKGIPLEQLTLENANAYELRVRKKTNELINQKQYQLKLASIEEVNSAIDAFDSAKIKVFYIQEMTHTLIEDFRKEVKILALKAAKDKAKYLLESIDQTVGNALEIVEVSDYNLVNARSNVAAPSFQEKGNEIGLKPILIKVSMKTKFEIK